MCAERHGRPSQCRRGRRKLCRGLDCAKCAKRNVVLSGPPFAINLVLKPRMLSGQSIYVLGPLHLGNNRTGDIRRPGFTAVALCSHPVIVACSRIGVPLSSEPKRTLSPSLNGMGLDSPSVHANSWKFPNRRVGVPELAIVPTEGRLFVFRFHARYLHAMM